MDFREKKGLAESNLPKREEIVRANIRELARRKEAGEIDTVDYELNYLYYLTLEGEPLRLSDVKKYARHQSGQAINITQVELKTLEAETGDCLRVVLAGGEVITIDSGQTGYRETERLIIFPEELGEIAKDMSDS